MGRTSSVLVAMSGGVDSSVAAARLRDAGYEVVGVTLRLVREDPGGPSGPATAPIGAGTAVAEAARVARSLSIEHHVLDCADSFERLVAVPFVQAYLEGRTPSPCVGCNRRVKLAEVLSLADRLGIEKVATGHYARVDSSRAGTPELFRGRDPNKDQSYFLCLLPPHWLARMVLPLGESTKHEVRDEASQRGLPVARRPESQELCFAPEGYLRFVERRAGDRLRPGLLVDASGRMLGEHRGIHRFTLGQRKGLGVALGYPAFVTHIDSSSGAVTLGPLATALAVGARLGEGRWDASLSLPAEVTVKVRSQHAGVRARLESALAQRAQAPSHPAEQAVADREAIASRAPGPPTPSEQEPAPDDATPRRVVWFEHPIAGVSPGQFAVAYDGDRVVGGATIDEVLRDGAG